MRVVLLGATGNFGARVVLALLRDPNIQLVAAGRHPMTIPGAESIESVVLTSRIPTFQGDCASCSLDWYLGIDVNMPRKEVSFVALRASCGRYTFWPTRAFELGARPDRAQPLRRSDTALTRNGC
jgi:dihydrodipicolinate reductase